MLRSDVFDRYRIPLIVLVVAVLLASYFYTQVDWDERAVHNQLNELTELIEKDGPVSTFDSVGRSRKLVNFFTKNPSIEYMPGRRLPKDMDSMSGAFLSVWGQIEKASVRISRHEVEINDDRAESTVTTKCSVILEGSDRMGDAIDYRINWIRFEGDWLIKSVVALGEF